eukprot:scaffold795_cov187-Amphora_coffeaeformis.AAC.19
MPGSFGGPHDGRCRDSDLIVESAAQKFFPNQDFGPPEGARRSKKVNVGDMHKAMNLTYTSASLL